MRDIRQDIQERLEAIERDRVALQRQMDALNQREASARAMLADEEGRIRSKGAGNRDLPFEGVLLVGGMQMTDLIKATLRGRWLTFDEVKEEIVKTPFSFGDEQKPGRVIHGGLLSLWRGGEIEKDASGRYGFPADKIPVQERTH